jgi:hypothetical protein
LVEGGVRLDFGDGWKLANPEGADFGDAAGAAQAQGVLAERGVRRDGELGERVFGVLDVDG